MLATWGSSSGINALLASSSLSLNFSNGSYTLGGVPYAVASVPGYSFTRSSGGYAQNVDGSLTWFTGTRTNLVTYSQDLTNAIWAKNAVTALANQTTAPDGTVTASSITETTATAQHYANYATSKAASAITYSTSVYIKPFGLTRNLKIGLFDGAGNGVDTIINPVTLATVSGPTYYGALPFTSVSVTTSTSSNGFVRIGLIFTSNVTPSVGFGIQTAIGTGLSFAGDASTGFYVWGAQLETATDTRITYPTAYIPTTTAAVSVDTPRITNKGYLSEEARTNVLTYSQAFDNAAWLVYLATKIGSAPVAAPDGTLTAYELSLGTTGGTFNSSSAVYSGYSGFTSGTNYSASIYVRAKTGTTSVRVGFTDTATSSISTTDVTVTTTWQRISVSGAAAATFTTGNFSIRTNTAGNSANVYVWGAQLEAGAFATSYIPTTTAAATRAADILKFTSISSWYNQTAGTLAVTTDASANSFTTYVAATNGVTAQNSVHIDNDTGNMRAVYYSGSAAVATLVLDAIGTVGALTKIATAYAVNDFSASRNGGAVVTDSSGALPISISQLNVGNDPAGVSTQYVDGYIKNVSYYNTRLSNAQLQAITA